MREVLVSIEAICIILTIVVTATAVPMVNSSNLLQDYSLLPGISAFASSGSSLTADSLAGLMYEIPTEVSVHDIAIFNGTMYASDVHGGKVLVMNLNGTLVDEIDVGSRPQYLEVRPDGQVLYVTRLGDPISVVDLEQKIVIEEIDSGDMPHRLSFTNGGDLLFVVNAESDTLSFIDSDKPQVIKTVPVGDSPGYVALNPDETLTYVTNMNSNTVSIVDADKVVNEIPVGSGPYGIAFSVDGGDLAYVSNTRGNDVSVIDTTSGNVTATISAGGIGPHQMVVMKPDVEIVRTEDNNNNNNSSVIVS